MRDWQEKQESDREKSLAEDRARALEGGNNPMFDAMYISVILSSFLSESGEGEW